MSLKRLMILYCDIQVDMENPWWLNVILVSDVRTKEELLGKIFDEISAVFESSKYSLKGKYVVWCLALEYPCIYSTLTNTFFDLTQK